MEVKNVNIRRTRGVDYGEEEADSEDTLKRELTLTLTLTLMGGGLGRYPQKRARG